jgi:hypothetical protein
MEPLMAKSSAPIKLSGTVLNSETGMCICSVWHKQILFIYPFILFLRTRQRERERVCMIYDDLEFGSRWRN